MGSVTVPLCTTVDGVTLTVCVSVHLGGEVSSESVPLDAGCDTVTLLSLSADTLMPLSPLLSAEL